MSFMNRAVVVVQLQGKAKPIVIGPFRSYVTACTRRDEIVEYLEDAQGMTDGTDYTIDAVACDEAATTNWVHTYVAARGSIREVKHEMGLEG